MDTPRNRLLGISSGIQVVEYTLSPWSATLLKARILFYIIKHYRKYVQYIYIFTHDCRQISERPELKEFFASAGLVLPLSPFLLMHDGKKEKRCHYANFDLEFSKWETINGNCNECKNTVLKKNEFLRQRNEISLQKSEISL